MSQYSAIKAAVNAYIKANGRKEITGNILNAVLNATISSLGKFYQFAGVALPSTDPEDPDQNVCYLAGEPGTYVHFDNIVLENEEIALLFWNGEWTKQRMLLGIQEVEATVDNQVGTPSVDVSYSAGRLVLTFHNLKGETGNTGAAAGFGTIGADITGGVGTPGVSVESSGSDTAKNLMFHFTNLKGETGVTSVIATVDNTTGTPQCSVSLVGGVLTLAFTGLKGLQGDTGVSADYPITIVNNLTTNDPTSALSAAMGVQLESEISQLEAEVTDSSTYKDTTTTKVSGVLPQGSPNNKIMTSSGYSSYYFAVNAGDKFKVQASNVSGSAHYAYTTAVPANNVACTDYANATATAYVNKEITATKNGYYVVAFVNSVTDVQFQVPNNSIINRVSRNENDIANLQLFGEKNYVEIYGDVDVSSWTHFLITTALGLSANANYNCSPALYLEAGTIIKVVSGGSGIAYICSSQQDGTLTAALVTTIGNDSSKVQEYIYTVQATGYYRICYRFTDGSLQIYGKSRIDDLSERMQTAEQAITGLTGDLEDLEDTVEDDILKEGAYVNGHATEIASCLPFGDTDTIVASGIYNSYYIPVTTGDKFQVVASNVSGAAHFAYTSVEPYIGVAVSDYDYKTATDYVNKEITAEQDGWYVVAFPTSVTGVQIQLPNNSLIQRVTRLESEVKRITIGTGGDFATIKDGFVYARQNDVDEVIVLPGVYDLVAEGIENWAEGYFNGYGYLVPKKVVGYGAKLVLNLDHENWNLSALYIDPRKHGSEIYGLTIEVTNCRYCIHDDMGGAPDYGVNDYKNVYRDLTLIHHSPASATLISPNAIGGGLGEGGEVYIENCIVSAANATSIDYHSSWKQTQSTNDKVMITNCVLNKKITCTSIGSATTYKNVMYVSNCVCNESIPDTDTANAKLVGWNNVVKQVL